MTDHGTESSLANRLNTEMTVPREQRYLLQSDTKWQKGSLENNYEEIRYICPSETNPQSLILNSKDVTNSVTSHINPFPQKD